MCWYVLPVVRLGLSVFGPAGVCPFVFFGGWKAGLVASQNFKAIKPIQRAQEVRNQLVRAIERGDYKPGDRLPSERELGEALGVSRVSVREGMRGLEAIGLVNVIHGRGAFVAEGPGERYLSPFADLIDMHRSEILELMRVRGALDELAAAEAAERGDPALIEAVERACSGFEQAAAEDHPLIEGLVGADIEFHLAIARASGSPLLEGLLEELNQLFAESRQVIFNQPRLVARSAKEHTAITEAIKTGQARKARTATARHIKSAIKALEQIRERSDG